MISLEDPELDLIFSRIVYESKKVLGLMIMEYLSISKNCSEIDLFTIEGNSSINPILASYNSRLVLEINIKITYLYLDS